jgi:hypothetical protein
MCYYERYDFSCGDHKWGNIKSRCELQFRLGETCGMAPRPLDGYIYRLQEQCRYCKDMKPKMRRIEKAESDIRRWQHDGPRKWRANIEKAQDDLQLLRRELLELNNKRSSVSRTLGSADYPILPHQLSSLIVPRVEKQSLNDTKAPATRPHLLPSLVDQSEEDRSTNNAKDLATRPHHLPSLIVQSEEDRSTSNGKDLATLPHHLPKLIDESEENQSTIEADALKSYDRGFTSTFLNNCQHLLAEIWRCCSQDQRRAVIQQNRIRNNLSRLISWGDSINNEQLDARVNRSAELRGCILEILHKIGTVLIKGT